MKKLAHILYEGNRQWVEITEKNIFLMHGIPTDKTFRRNKKIKEDLEKLDYLAPTFPNKVIGVGWNYKDLVGEKESYEEPLIFLKSPHSICPTFSDVPFPTSTKEVWVEVELVIVIRSKCSNGKFSKSRSKRTSPKSSRKRKNSFDQENLGDFLQQGTP